MSKIGRWRKIFGYTKKPKTPVRVGEGIEHLTGTQAYRFEELTKSRRPASPAVDAAVPEKCHYSLAEASSQLHVSEDQLAQQAAAGSVCFYIDAAGLLGRWRRGTIDGHSEMSAVQTLLSGYLALTVRACGDLAANECVNVSILEFRCPSDPSILNLNQETMTALSAWGESDKHFCLLDPLRVDRSKVVLMAPLPTLTL